VKTVIAIGAATFAVAGSSLLISGLVLGAAPDLIAAGFLLVAAVALGWMWLRIDHPAAPAPSELPEDHTATVAFDGYGAYFACSCGDYFETQIQHDAHREAAKAARLTEEL